MEMILTGAPICRRRGERIGLVNRVGADSGADGRSARAWRDRSAQRAGRDALHHRRRQPGHGDAVRRGLSQYEATLFGLVASTDDMREGTRERFSRSARPRSRASDDHRSIEDARRAFRFALVVSKYHDFVTDRLQSGALDGADCGRRRRRRRDDRSRAGRVRDPARGAARGRERPLRCRRLPRVPDSRRDAALRLHLLGGRARADGRGGGHRRADGVRRADHQLASRGAGTRRRRSRQQGDARPRRHAIEMADGRRAAGAVMTHRRRATRAAKKDPRHRAREAALQILYQWDIGAATSTGAAETFFSQQWPDARRAGRRASDLRVDAGARHRRAAARRSTR